MGIDTAAATQYAGQGQSGAAPSAPGQNPMLARLMPLIQQRMQQQAQSGGAISNVGQPLDMTNPVNQATAQQVQADSNALGTANPAGVRGVTGPPVVVPSGGDASVSSAPQPAWQQLAARGIPGQGSAAANKAKLAELQGATGAPAGADIALDPMMVLRKKIMDVAGAGAVRRDAKPADAAAGAVRGAVGDYADRRGQVGVAQPGVVPADGGLQAKPMPGVVVDPAPATSTASGRRPRIRPPQRLR